MENGCELSFLLLCAGHSKKSNSSSEAENTATIPEETGSDGDEDIEFATKVEPLDHPALPAGDDIAMMDEDEESSRMVCDAVDALSEIRVSEANGRPPVHRNQVPAGK